MKIHEYNEMMAYMLRPRQKFAIGGGVVEGEDLGSREGFDAPRTVLFDDDKLVAEWRKQLTGKDPLKWNVFLVKKFGESGRKTLDSRIIRKFKIENIPWDPGKEFSIARYKAVEKLVDEHNLSDKFLYNKQDIYKELNLSRLTRNEYPEIFKLFDTLESKDDKVKKAFDKIVDENLTIYRPKKLRASSGQKGGLLKQMISDIVSPKTGSLQKVSTPLYIQKVLNTHQDYLDMKDDFDYLDKYQSSNFVNKSFNEALEYSQYSRGGLDIKNLTEFKGSYANPDKQIYSFAARHAYLNNKKGTPSQIKFFKLDKKGNPVGKELNFNELPKDAKTSARMLDSKKYGFTYKDKFFNQNTLKTEGFKSGLFDEVYDLVKKGQKLVPNPNNPSEQITLRKLLQDTGDKLTIGHNDAKGGITKQPFNNLRIESGKLNLSLYGAYSRVKNKQLRKLIVDNLAIQFPSIKEKGDKYEQAFIKEQSNIVKNLNKEKVSLSPYRAAGTKVIKDLGEDFFKKSKSFQKQALRVAGIRATDNQKTIIKKINEAPLPIKVKSLILPIAIGATAITGADLMTGPVQAAEAGEGELPAQINQIDEGFTNTEKLLAGTTAGAAIAARKPLLRTLGKVVRPFGFPSVAAGFAAGELLSDDPNLGIAGAELLAPELTKQVGVRGFLANPFQLAEKASRFGKIGRGIASLARAPAMFTPIGLTLLGAEGIMMGMKEQDRINLMRETDPEAYQEYLAEQEDLLGESA